MNTEALLLFLFELGTKVYAQIAEIKAGDPAAYERVSQQVKDSLDRAKAALD